MSPPLFIAPWSNSNCLLPTPSGKVREEMHTDGYAILISCLPGESWQINFSHYRYGVSNIPFLNIYESTSSKHSRENGFTTQFLIVLQSFAHIDWARYFSYIWWFWPLVVTVQVCLRCIGIGSWGMLMHIPTHKQWSILYLFQGWHWMAKPPWLWKWWSGPTVGRDTGSTVFRLIWGDGIKSKGLQYDPEKLKVKRYAHTHTNVGQYWPESINLLRNAHSNDKNPRSFFCHQHSLDW
jgi:hypothetical protein